VHPETRYARSGDLHVAYQVVGDGPIDIVLIDQWFSHVEAQWEFAPFARLLERLASFSRLIVFDKRGTGLSDPVAISTLPSLEQWMDDLRAVLDSVGSQRVALVAGVGACYVAMLFAATFPESTAALVLIDPYARLHPAPDYPYGRDPQVLEPQFDSIRGHWGQGVLLDLLVPSAARNPEVRSAWARYERQSASPGAAIAMIRMLYESDVRHVLPAIRVPTLVIQRAQSARIPPELGRYVAERIAGAKYVEVPGTENLIWAGEQETIVAEIQEFLTGVRPVPESDRVLATVVFTDLVGSTERAARLGDRRWRDLLDQHDTVVRRELGRFRGREIKSLGDGFLATFDGPARAIRCSVAVRKGVEELGIMVRTGIHTGEIELAGDDVRGIAVHIAARVAALAGSGEILVSSTVKDLVVGSGIEFEDRGAHLLKGVPGDWRLSAVSDT
jgi:class 3 adenylate cyclase